ncbi:MAG: 23S rRNA (uracil(1939)-C(5))-methyltransferase RlmD [Holosporales bacterium]
MNHNSPFQTKQGKIIHLTADGFGRLIDENGKNVDLPFCVTGDVVSYDDVKRRRHTDYYLRDVVAPSPQRQAPICPHFTKCGGCLLQHLPDQDYRDFKKSIVTQLCVEHDIDPFIVENPVVIEQGNRRRTNVEAIKKNGVLFFGFHQIRSHRIIDIDVCPVLHPAIERCIKGLKIVLEHVLSDFQKAKLFITHTDVGVDLSLEIQDVSTLSADQIDKLTAFAIQEDVCRFVFKYRKTILTLHEKAVPYVLMDDVPVNVDPWCFLQASQKADEILVGWVMNHLGEKPQSIIDLFCGRGTFTLPLSKFGYVQAFEFDKHALAALDQAKGARSIQTHYRNLFDQPLFVDELNHADVVVIDPPRAGARAQCELLSRSHVERVIYVSCNPHTFMKDAKTLIKGGYCLEKIYLLDQFIYTAHIECVGVFIKKS